jgi:choline-sulfatase
MTKRAMLLMALGAVLGGWVLQACGGAAATGPTEDGRPAVARDLEVQQDLVEMAHLADVDHHGLFIDFGGPARAKYTVGNWGSGWGEDGADGDITYTYASDLGRVYFPLDTPRALTLRFQLRPVGSHRMQVFFNNEALETVRLEEGDSFRSYDVEVPAEHTRAGDNYLLLRFGGTTQVRGQAVSAAVGSIRVLDDAGDDAYAAPYFDTLVSTVALGEDERRALAVRAPTRLAYHLEVPEGGRLVLAVGAEGEGEARARVLATVDGQSPRELFAGPVTDAWQDLDLDLGGLAGEAVRLELSAEGSTNGRVAFAMPAVMVPPVEAQPDPPEVRNVIVLLVDTLRASKLRPYDEGSRVEAPVFERLAEEGVLFEEAQSPENWTKPSCASVLTGLTPATHGAKTSEARLPDGAELLSEALDDAGFATGSFIANGYVSDRFGFDQGWDHYQNFIRNGESTEAENVFRTAGDWIERNRDRRFFAYVQTIDPHVPYDPPGEDLAPYDSGGDRGRVEPRRTPELLEDAKQRRVRFTEGEAAHLEALHDGEISYHDRMLGQFLERLERMGVLEDTLIVITSDHGEEFRDHGSWGHGHSIFQELLHVPLLFHWPRGFEARRVPYPVSTMNVAQTVLDLTGVEGMARAEGRSLLPDLLGRLPEGPQVAFSDFQDIRRVVRTGRYKLVVRANLTSVLFDLEADPGELEELAVNDRPIAGRHARILLGQYLGAANRARWLDARQEAAAPLSAEEAEMDDTIRAQLRALGYAN